MTNVLFYTRNQASIIEKDGVVGSGNGILGLFGGGSGNSMLGWMSPGIGGGSQGGASLIIILGIVIWLVTILVGSPSLPVITPRAIRQGLLSGLLAGLKLGIPISIVGIPFFTLFGGLQHGISYGLGIGFFLGILVGLMHGLEVGLWYEQQQLSPQTTEKISFSDRLIDGLILGIGAGLSFMVVEDLLKVSHTSTLIYSGIVFLFFFFAYGFGGGTNLFASLAQTIMPTETVIWSASKKGTSFEKKATLLQIVIVISSGILSSSAIATALKAWLENRKTTLTIQIDGTQKRLTYGGHHLNQDAPTIQTIVERLSENTNVVPSIDAVITVLRDGEQQECVLMSDNHQEILTCQDSEQAVLLKPPSRLKRLLPRLWYKESSSIGMEQTTK